METEPQEITPDPYNPNYHLQRLEQFADDFNFDTQKLNNLDREIKSWLLDRVPSTKKQWLLFLNELEKVFPFET